LINLIPGIIYRERYPAGSMNLENLTTHLAQELVMDVVHPLIVIRNSAVVVQDVLQRRQALKMRSTVVGYQKLTTVESHHQN